MGCASTNHPTHLGSENLKVIKNCHSRKIYYFMMEDTDDKPTIDPDFREILEKFRVDIVQTLDLERHYIFAYLRSNSVFDEEDCEIILNSGPGRKQKVAKFLDVLACKGQEGFHHFKASLEIEHPKLYEKITGKRPEKRMNPVETLQKFGGSIFGGGMAGKDLIDFDRQYLATQLEKTAGDLKMLSHIHSKTIHEKNALERKVIEASSNLEDQQKEVQELREQLESSRLQSSTTVGKNAGNSFTLQRYIQELMAENADKSNRIISLQQSVLDAVQNAEKDRASYLDLQRRHEEVLQKLRDVTINYDWERRNSIRMSEKMRKQCDQIKIGEDLRREIFELKLKLSEMQDQRDEARDELREFRNVTEALSAKFDSIRQQKDKAMEYQAECSSTMAELEAESQYLQSKLQEAYLDLNDLKRKNMRLLQDSQTMKEQRNALLQDREIAISERNVSMKDLEEALRLNQNLRQSRDESVEAHLKINKMLQDDYNKIHEEMDVVRHELRVITEENESLRLKLRQIESARNMAPLEESEQETENAGENDSSPHSDEAQLDGKEEADKLSTVGSERLKKSRSSSAILNSAYRKIKESGNSEDYFKHRASLPAVLTSYENETLLFTVEDSAVPKTTAVAQDQEKSQQQQRKQQQQPDCNDLKIDVKAARAFKSSESQHGTVDFSSMDSAKSVSSIVPFISELSMSFAVSSGSQESLCHMDRSNSPTTTHLKSPEPRKKHSSKSVSPKALYKIDRLLAFDFPFHKTISKGNKGDLSGPKLAGPGRDDNPDKSERGKPPMPAGKSLSANRGATIERSSQIKDSLEVNLPKRRHSSADLMHLSLMENQASDV